MSPQPFSSVNKLMFQPILQAVIMTSNKALFLLFSIACIADSNKSLGYSIKSSRFKFFRRLAEKSSGKGFEFERIFSLSKGIK